MAANALIRAQHAPLRSKPRGAPSCPGFSSASAETRERLEALTALRDLHARYGHIQEIIIQPFRAKPGTRMHNAPEPSEDDLLWTIAAARLIMGPSATIQTPPNLSPAALAPLIEAGANDLGGVSPLTPDFVNPEAPWPHLGALATQLAERGYELAERLTIYPAYAANAERWIDPALAPRIRALVDAEGWPREDEWISGQSQDAPAWSATPGRTHDARVGKLDRILGAERPSSRHRRATRARREHDDICAAADCRKPKRARGISYRHRSINYNICTVKVASRLFQGPRRARAARRAVSGGRCGNHAPHRRSLVARRDRGVPARGHPSRL